MIKRGYFGIGIYNGKNTANIGTLWRSAAILGANFIFTIDGVLWLFAGRFETNQEAKIWRLVDPSGNEIIVRNLLLWARENTERFGKPPGDRSAIQIASGFEAIAATLRGTRKMPSMTYFGWTLKDVPEVPPPEG